VDSLGIVEAHLPLGRVDIHIDGRGGDAQEEHRGGEASARKEIPADLEQRVAHQSVAHWAPVHEEVDSRGGGPVRVRPGDVGAERHLSPLALRRHQRRGIPLREDRGDPIEGILHRGPGEGAPAVPSYVEVDLRQGEGGPGQPVSDVPPLGGGGLQELSPRRDVAEQLRDLDSGPLGPRRGARRDQFTALDP